MILTTPHRRSERPSGVTTQVALLALILTVSPTASFAQSASPDEEPPAVQAPVSAQEASVGDGGEGRGAATELETEPERPKRDNRSTVFGFGPGVVFWPPGPDETGYEASPALALELRRISVAGGIIGFEWTNNLVFHDWQAMADGYGLYFDKAETEEERQAKAVRLGVLWPGLLLIPFAAANYSTGGGLIVYTSSRVPSMYFDIGGQLNLYLRLSDADFRADFGLGAYGGLGYDFSDHVGFGARFMWGTPIVHNLTNKTAHSIITTNASLNITF